MALKLGFRIEGPQASTATKPAFWDSIRVLRVRVKAGEHFSLVLAALETFDSFDVQLTLELMIGLPLGRKVELATQAPPPPVFNVSFVTDSDVFGHHIPRSEASRTKRAILSHHLILFWMDQKHVLAQALLCRTHQFTDGTRFPLLLCLVLVILDGVIKHHG